MPEVEPSETFPNPRNCPFSAPPDYARKRIDEPVSKVPVINGGEAWLITRHEDFRSVLTDPRMSSNRDHPDFPSLVRPRRGMSNSLLGMDPPHHNTARRAILGEFTMRRLESLRPRVQEIVDECVDQILATTEPIDLVTTLSLPVPSLVICELLGVPYSDHDFFQDRSGALFNKYTPDAERMRLGDELLGYLDQLVTSKENEPTDDVLSRQIAKNRDANDGKVNHQAMVALAFLLLVAGHETTANQISLGVLALLENPDQLATITADPTKTPAAVEELLRYFSIVDGGTPRVATEDLDIGGVRIRKGDGVVPSALAANRDPNAFENPDTLDLSRNARGHVAFGFGAHQCLGQNLARMELQIVFDTLFRRVPDLRLAVPVDELPFKEDSNIYGIHAMPVTWGD